MNLKDARANYYTFSSKTSDIIRQLGLAAIAIIWLFHTGPADKLAIPPQLFLPLKLVVAGLAFDLLQYATAAFLWIQCRNVDAARSPTIDDHPFGGVAGRPKVVVFQSENVFLQPR